MHHVQRRSISGFVCPKRKLLFAQLRKRAAERLTNTNQSKSETTIQNTLQHKRRRPNETQTQPIKIHLPSELNPTTTKKKKTRKKKKQRKYSGSTSKDGFQLFQEPDQNGCLGECCYSSIDHCEHNAPQTDRLT
jgi:hypothetical protein